MSVTGGSRLLRSKQRQNNDNRKSPNTSVISIVSNCKPEKNPEKDILQELRDKLASANYHEKELEERIVELEEKVNYLNNKSQNQKTLLASLHQTIKDLSGKKTCVVHMSTQTDLSTEHASTQTLGLTSQDMCTQTEISVVGDGCVGEQGFCVLPQDSEVMLEEHQPVLQSIHGEYEGATQSTHYYKTVKHNDVSVHRILMLTDSCGRNYGRLLRNNLTDNFQMLNFVKPSAKLVDVIADLEEKIGDFSDGDYLYVQAGTNDISCCYDSEGIGALLRLYRDIMERTRHTNIVISTIPYRFDRPEYNAMIEYINMEVYNIASNYSHVAMFTINNILCRRFYTWHGLHLNRMGKNIVCQHLVDYFRDAKFIDSGKCAVECDDGARALVEPMAALVSGLADDYVCRDVTHTAEMDNMDGAGGDFSMVYLPTKTK